MSRRIEVVDYSTVWPDSYRLEAEKIQAIASNLILSIHHIGSTAVPGLAAKPVIDILLEVQEIEVLDTYNPAFKALGYLCRGEYGIPGRRYFAKGGDERTHHIHAFAVGSPHLARHLAFRDYLRIHPEIREAYAVLKREAATVCNHDIEAYMRYKHNFVAKHEQKALGLLP